MKTLILGFSLLLFASASAYSLTELENISTLIHLAQHEEVFHHSHHESHHEHDHDSEEAKGHSKRSHGSSVTISHKHSSQGSDEGKNEPHEHHLDLFSGFTAILIEATLIETASFDLPKPLLLEPSQLISDPHRSRLFRPPIS